MNKSQAEKVRNPKVIIITGAASGIGLSAVNIFKQDPSYFIYAVDKNTSVKNLVDKNTYPIELDLTNQNEVLNFIQRVMKERECIDILINNAGILNVGRTNLYYDQNGEPKDEYKKLWETNYDTPLYLTNLVLPIMRKQKGGTIINVTSTKEYVRDPFHEPYSDCKAALTKATLKIAGEEKVNNIHIVALQPGNTKTNIDKGDWISDSNTREAFEVQSMNNWWRKFFGNNPKNVANIMYKIVEGKIKRNRVIVGIDAHLAYYAHYIPFWPIIFSFFYQTALLITKIIFIKKKVYSVL